ncbi:MAG: carboxypeptidase regulatory-like domain-containing protein [Verrucomicrobiales bacterium]|nr:carboxypeptidase regulatory-like domain-containing protein [Verrucomicrobiales bacterium]
MRRALSCVFWGGFIARSLGGTPELELRLGLSEMAAEAGRIATRNVVIRNPGTQAMEVREVISWPAGWNPVPMGDPVFEIPPGGTCLRIVAVAIPGTGAAGRQEGRYRLLNRRNDVVVGETVLPLEVLSSGRVEVSMGDAPSSVVAGDPIAYTATFMNRGNCEVQISVSGKSSPQAAVEVFPGTFPLAAGAVAEVKIRVPTDAAHPRRVLQLVQWVAEARWGTSGFVKIPMPSQVIEVIASAGPKFDPYHRLPVQWTTTAAWESGRDPGIQTELSGRGALTEDGAVRTDFRFRGPDGGGASSSLRRQEEYGFSLSSAIWDVHLGDRPFSVSPLLKSLGNQRGIGLDYHQDGIQAGLFAMKDRTDPSAPQEFGGYLGWTAPPGLSLRWNSLGTADREGRSMGLHSVQTGWSLSRRLQVLFEAALDDAASDLGEGTAWRAEAHGRWGEQGGWHASHTRAGREFHGATTDRSTTATGFFQELNSWARVAGEFRWHEDGGVGRGVAVGNAARNIAWKLGPRIRLTERTTIHADYRQSAQEMIGLERTEQGREDAVLVGVTREFQRWSVGFEQEFGRSEREAEGVSGAPGTPLRSSLTALWRASDRQTYSGSLAVTKDMARGNSGPAVEASVAGTWQVARATRWHAAVHHRQDPEGQRTETALQAGAEWTLPNRHEIGGTVRVAGLGGVREVESSVMVNYRIPLNLAMSRRRGFGTIQGRVMDGDGASARPLARAVVRLNTGDTAVTDAGGRYLFAGLKAGEYTVTVDQRSLGFGRVTAELIPQRLVVGKDAIAALDIMVVSGASLTVTLTVFEETPALPPAAGGAAETAASHRPVAPQVGEVVEVSNGHETFRRLTSASGEAVFPNLRPGRWSVRAYDSQLPERHWVERPERERHLEPGAKGREEFRVLPRRRKVLLIDS